MSFRLYDLKSGLDSDDAVEFNCKAILYKESDVNKLVRDHKEKLNHFSAKAILLWRVRIVSDVNCQTCLPLPDQIFRFSLVRNISKLR